MKQFLSFAIVLGIAATAVFGEVTFSGLDLSDANRLLFTATVDIPDYGEYSTLLSSNLSDGKLHQLSYFPEQMTFLSDSGELQIQNRFGVFRSNKQFTAFHPVANFPSFVNGKNIQTGRISPIENSPDGRFQVYLDETSAAYAKLILYDSQTRKSTTIADRVELSLQGPPVSWSPQSDYFIYAKDGTLYYFSIAQLLQNRVLTEDLRVIGSGTIANVRWGDNDDVYYIAGSFVFHIQSVEFFTRSLYQSLLGVGTIVGKIPFTFDPNFDKFWISPGGDKVMLDKGGRNLFLYFLRPDDYFSTGSTISLPYLFLPKNTNVTQVVWAPDDRITVLTQHIDGGSMATAVYRLDVSRSADSYAFKQEPDKGIRSMVLDSANQRYIVLLTANGLILKDYASWKTLRTISHPDPLHALWTPNGNVVVAGRYYSELIDISSAASAGTSRGGSSHFIAFSQAGKYGFSVPSGQVEMSTKNIVRGYDPESNSWKSVTSFRVAPAAVVSSQYRVYVESLSSRSYRNMVMVRNLNGVQTVMLFKPPEQRYEPFPKQDEPVDMTYFTHGSRIRRREVALVFNAIRGVDGLNEVLKVLKEYGVHATFFVSGDFIREHPGATKAIADSGQEVGSLFFSYFNMTDSRYKIGTTFIEQGLARTEDEYFRATGKELSLLWHAPYYFVSPDVMKATRAMHYTYVGRDVDSLDWVPAHDDDGLSKLYRPAADLVQRIMSDKKPGSIISLTIGRPEDNLASSGTFVGSRNDYLFQKLDVLLNALIARGYSEVTISTLMNHAH